ncbi:hypothetical protein Droror1_Dr00023609, partial [Drosera rotundifolia]
MENELCNVAISLKAVPMVGVLGVLGVELGEELLVGLVVVVELVNSLGMASLLK